MAETNLIIPLLELGERANWHSLTAAIWSDETTESDWNKNYELAEYVAFFDSRKVVMLHFDYEIRVGNTNLSQRLMIEKFHRETALEIICYREPILSASNPKQAISDAVSEFRNLKRLFQGDALFLGPDTLNYPKSPTDYPKEWLKIE
ncbi:MAG: hypothetical protein HKN28_12690 [Alphaproteobacteria bacterium]|nr:hypothetical protein [Alphaproteobacteria bacterium]